MGSEYLLPGFIVLFSRLKNHLYSNKRDSTTHDEGEIHYHHHQSSCLSCHFFEVYPE